MEMDLTTALKDNGVIPEVINTVPKNLVQVHYPNDIKVNLGNELTPLSVKEEPTVDWPVDTDTYYTLLMVDKDAPSRRMPILGPINHWLVVNIPGAQVSKGETLTGYAGSGPPKWSGLHRYVFIVYKQNGIITHSAKRNDGLWSRMRFNTRKFEKDFNLGEPYAVNFFQSQYTRE